MEQSYALALEVSELNNHWYHKERTQSYYRKSADAMAQTDKRRTEHDACFCSAF